MANTKRYITPTGLEEDIREEQAANSAVLAELDSLFANSDFKRTDDMNHISFQASEGSIKAQYSLDNSTYSFTCYISEVDNNSFNYSRKGTKYQAVEAAEKFLAEYDDCITNTEAEDYTEDELFISNEE